MRFSKNSKLYFVFSNKPNKNPKLESADLIFIGGIPLKTLENIFIDVVKSSNSAKSNKKNGKVEEETELDRVNIRNSKTDTFAHLKINQLLQKAHDAEMIGDLKIAVANRLAATTR